MDGILRQGTVATIMTKPIVDETTGAPETGLTISQADVKLSKNGGAFAQKNEATSATHAENGRYSFPVDTTDTGTVGRLQGHIYESGTLIYTFEYMIMSQAAYDFLYGSTALPVNVTAMADGVITAAKIADNAITAAKIADGAIDAATFAAGAINAAAIADDAIDAGAIAADALAASELAATAASEIAAAVGAVPAAATIAGAVWDKLRADHNVSGSFGEGLTDVRQRMAGRVEYNAQTGVLTIYETDGTTTRFVLTETAVSAIIAALVPS